MVIEKVTKLRLNIKKNCQFLSPFYSLQCIYGLLLVKIRESAIYEYEK